MNIANIFGLHLGCKVKFSTGEIAILSGVDSDHIHINNTLRHYQIKDCKLLLKPLSAISEEDKAEFVEEFIPDEDATKYWFEMTYNRVQLFGIDDFYDISVEETLWLASKGYDVGIVPDEYKEI